MEHSGGLQLCDVESFIKSNLKIFVDKCANYTDLSTIKVSLYFCGEKIDEDYITILEGEDK